MSFPQPLRRSAAVLVAALALGAAARPALAEGPAAPPAAPPAPAPALPPAPAAPILGQQARSAFGSKSQLLNPLEPGIAREWTAQHAVPVFYAGLTANFMVGQFRTAEGPTAFGTSYRLAAELALPGGVGVNVGYFPRTRFQFVLELTAVAIALSGVEVSAGIGLQLWFVRACVGLDAPWNPYRQLLGNVGIDALYTGEGAFGLGLSLRAF